MSFFQPFRGGLWLGALAIALIVPLSANPEAAARGSSSASARPEITSIARGLELARSEHKRVFVDFGFPGCENCEAMEATVLVGPAWEELGKRAIRVKSNIEEPEGARWQDKLHIAGYPEYVVLNENGKVLGKFGGASSADIFYAKVDGILDHSLSDKKLTQEARGGSLAAAKVMLQRLRGSSGGRRESQRALAWYGRLPAAVRRAGANDHDLGTVLDRTEVAVLFRQKSPPSRDLQRIVQIAQNRLKDPLLGCDYPEFLGYLEDGSKGLPDRQRKSLLRTQEPRLKQFIAQKTLQIGATCPSTGDAVVEVGVRLHEALGDKSGARNIYKHAIAFHKRQIGTDLANNNFIASENVTYLRKLGENDQAMALEKQVADAVNTPEAAEAYAYDLLTSGHAAAALPYTTVELNRAPDVPRKLAALSLRIMILKALHRGDEVQGVRDQADRIAAKDPRALAVFRMNVAQNDAQDLLDQHKPRQARRVYAEALQKNSSALKEDRRRYQNMAAYYK